MSYLANFINQSNEQQQARRAEQSEQEARKAKELSVFRETATPLEARLKKLIATIPSEELNTPRPLEWFRTRLMGVEGRGAHAGRLGEALRKLNYERKRTWSDSDNGFRSLWHPTISTKTGVIL
jgi:hypothetical protein